MAARAQNLGPSDKVAGSAVWRAELLLLWKCQSLALIQIYHQPRHIRPNVMRRGLLPSSAAVENELAAC